MSSEQVSNDEFLAKLTHLLESTSSSHSVFVNHKRVVRDESSSSSSSSSSGQWPVVYRATDGKGKANSGRTKFSTHVEPGHILSFQERCSGILRTSLATFLKKRDKAKERRADKLLKEKRKRMEEAEKIKVTAVGSNRGAGRRKRAQAKRKALKMRQDKQKASRTARSATSGTAGTGVGV